MCELAELQRTSLSSGFHVGCLQWMSETESVTSPAVMLYLLGQLLSLKQLHQTVAPQRLLAVLLAALLLLAAVLLLLLPPAVASAAELPPPHPAATYHGS